MARMTDIRERELLGGPEDSHAAARTRFLWATIRSVLLRKGSVQFRSVYLRENERGKRCGMV